MTAAVATDADLEEYRRELTGYCYRMLGSAFDAEDAVQETMVRAWKALDRFEGRSSLRSWLYRIATNVCMDTLGSGQRRARPMDLSSTAWQPVADSLSARRANEDWLEPMVDERVLPPSADPAEVAAGRESIRLAFVSALQHLPPRQRSVLILREVLRWQAKEVAELLDTTVASVNSALQRARATLDGLGEETSASDPMDDDVKDLLDRYVAAFEAYDIDAFVQLLHEDATQNMPPFEMWLAGREDIAAWMLGPGCGCRGSRTIVTSANGAPAIAQYRLVESAIEPLVHGPGDAPPGDMPADATHLPWALHVLDIRDGRVAGITSFLDVTLFELFGLPRWLPASAD
ncbi:RNA polymerase sigma-70 factor (ECF subfamily) [Mumia flava]|uniref:RNA polymerase sigma-70 factor (ECF subfamily) n=1 Tax=Mumia flava TaxID=1348852 RepID=A0A0B2B286_9ACTN|nr:sigma-70 family RNA polymerase sigma factor [Mumia flava]PJJ57814.1 RNA polymerase sigma-70 factor (ECF subfamily) [Mumia flava]